MVRVGAWGVVRLARGEEIPCFALTEPEAGSDAASLTSEGTVFRARDGRLSLRLNWRKRYITLAPVATLLGLGIHSRGQSTSQTIEAPTGFDDQSNGFSDPDRRHAH